MPLLIVPFMTVTSISVQGFSSISSNSSLSTFSAQSYFESLVTILDVNGLTEVEENDFKDTVACDDDAHKVILCVQSLILSV